MHLHTAAAGLQHARQAASAAPTRDGGHATGDPPRVLLVDPQAIVRRALADLLRLEGMTVCQAAEADGALAAVSEWHPTVVVTELAGIEAIDAIHQLDQRLPVIIHSAGFHPGTVPADGRFGAFRSIGKGGAGSVTALITGIRIAHADYHQQGSQAMQRARDVDRIT